jgi:hypothetical protein
LPVPKGRYYLWAGAFSTGRHVPMSWHPVGGFDVDGADQISANGILMLSPVYVETDWTSE